MRSVLKRLPRLVPAVRALAFVAVAAAAQAQTTWYVDAAATPPGNGTALAPYASIGYALAQPATVDGDTLLVAPGAYRGNPWIGKGVTVRSSGGPQVTRIFPDQTLETVVVDHASAVLEGFTVLGTSAGFADAVMLVRGTLRRCVVTGSTNTWGFGVEVVLGGSIEHCTIIGNRIGVAPSPPYGAAPTLRNSIVAHNSQEDYGGAQIGPVDYCAGLDNDPFWLTWGVGNLPVDPQTHFPAWGQPQLLSGSVCIDAGDPAAPPDPDGSRADIGALPFDPAFLPGPTVYCTGKLNSQGCAAAIGFQGQASASSASPFLVTASQVVPQRVGLLFYGLGERAKPFQGGTHCVQPPTPRTTFQISSAGPSCAGTFSFDMNAWIQSGVDPRLVPGAPVHAQYWYRDPGDPAGFGTGLSNALSFYIAP